MNNSKAIQSQIASSVCLEMFKRIGVSLPQNPHPSNLIGVEINRDALLGTDIYGQMGDLLDEMRGVFSASGMRCLRSTSASTEKNPMINTLRQVCKLNGLLLTPYSRSDGYEINGKKRLKRWFVVESADGFSLNNDIINQENINNHSLKPSSIYVPE
jgi:hypothetical protein